MGKFFRHEEEHFGNVATTISKLDTILEDSERIYFPLKIIQKPLANVHEVPDLYDLFSDVPEDLKLNRHIKFPTTAESFREDLVNVPMIASNNLVISIYKSLTMK